MIRKNDKQIDGFSFIVKVLSVRNVENNVMACVKIIIARKNFYRCVYQTREYRESWTSR